MTAQASASRLLLNGIVLKRIDELLDIYINDQVVDKETAFVVIQKKDLNAKVAAIREYNKVKGRITTKLKFVDENEDLSDEELEREIARRSGQKPATSSKTKST
jgi:hypothetical protein